VRVPLSLSKAQARRIALAAQGFCDPWHLKPTMRTFARTLARTGVLQVDSVNVLQRAHYMPLFSRMGAYDTGLLGRAAHDKPRRIVEYWAHAQAFMPAELWPFMGHRMRSYREQRAKWPVLAASPGLEASVLAEIGQAGPSTARDLDDGRPREKHHWGWNWSETRQVLDYLYSAGDLAIAGRNQQFEVRYDLPQRVIPPGILNASTPSVDETARELVRRAAASHGVGTARCLRDYYRMQHDRNLKDRVTPAIADLVEAGELLPVTVEGWQAPAYLYREARLPRRVEARALLSPFDPLVWERARTEALFDFHYRIEIYVPAPERVYGYYVLPFLLGDQIVARVDLKADRQAGALRVRGAYAEHAAPGHTAAELAHELRELAGWLILDDIVVEDRGDLAPALSALTGRA
jgi:uncharacterized protein